MSQKYQKSKLKMKPDSVSSVQSSFHLLISPCVPKYQVT